MGAWLHTGAQPGAASWIQWHYSVNPGSPQLCVLVGHVIITGGLGALGSLVGAWLHAGAQSGGNSCTTLLGRTARLNEASIQHTLAHAQQQVCILSYDKAISMVLHSSECECLGVINASIGLTSWDEASYQLWPDWLTFNSKRTMDDKQMEECY